MIKNLAAPATSSLNRSGRLPGATNANLDDRDRIAAAIYVNNGCKPGSYSEIANALNLSYSYVNTMFRRPRMRAYIREMLTQKFNQLELSSERVMQELAAIAFIRVNELFDENGDLYQPHMLPDHVAAALGSIEIEKRFEGRAGARTDDDPDGSVEEVVTKKYKFHSKNDALRTLAQHFKIIGGADEGVNALASALADKLKAARTRLPNANSQPVEEATIIDTPNQEPPHEEPIW